MKTSKARKLLQLLTPDQTAVDFSVFDQEVDKLKSALKDKIQAQTIDDVSVQLEKFKKKLNLEPLFDSFKKLEGNVSDKIKEIYKLLEEETKNLEAALSNQNSTEEVARLTASVDFLNTEITKLNTHNIEIQLLKSRISQLDSFKETATSTLSGLALTLEEATNTNEDNLKKEIALVQDTIDGLRKELTNRINSIPRGGGNMNRNISIGGNQSVLSRYTDINLKAGSNVTITYSNNNTTKYVDVTIAATGGSGGTVRSINSVSVDTAAGSTSGTDYVYLCSGTMVLTLPDATTNTNLYTVKNVGSGTITVATTAAQTIDGSASITLPVQYTAVDLISDTANWNVT